MYFYAKPPVPFSNVPLNPSYPEAVAWRCSVTQNSQDSLISLRFSAKTALLIRDGPATLY